MPAYVPPALRGAAAGASGDLPKLPDRIWKVQLSWTTGGPFSVESCPQTLLPSEGEPGKVTVRTFELPSEVSIGELRELFAWFAKQSVAAGEEHPQGDPRCAMAFPPSLSKEQRKMMHGLAEAHRLPTFSRGLGDERRLAVHGPAYASTPEMAEDVAAVAERKRAPQRLRERAKKIWRWCQADGGALWAVSQGEIEEALLAAPDESKLPAAVKDLLERREHGTALIGAIRVGDSASALAVLSAHPRAAWIRDDSGEQPQGGKGAHGRGGQGQHGQGGSGGGHGEGEGPGADGAMGYYPLHLAALAGMAEVVEAIAAQPGAVEQRDKNYATPLKVAKKAGQAAMVELLLKHGAKDYEVNQASHKTAAMPVPVPSGGGRRGSQSHAASPHVGSPAHGSPHASGSAGAGSYMAAHSHGRQARTSSDVGGPGRHGPSSLGKNQHGHLHGHGQGHGTPGRRSIDEQHGGQQGHHNHHQQQHAGGGSGAKGAQDPVFNPFAVLASVDSGSGGNGGGGRSRRNSSSSTGKPPRPPAGGDGGGSDSDTAAAPGRAAGGGRAGRGSSAHRCMLPPIQSGEVPDDVAMAALASVGMSAAPLLATAQEVGEEACSGDDDQGSGDDGAGGDAPRRRKTRRGRRGRGSSRRNSVATTDEAAAAAMAAAANGVVAAMPAAVRALRVSGGGAVVGSAPTGGSGANLLNAYMAGRGKGGKGNSSAGGSAHGGDSDSGSDSGSDQDDSGSRTRRGGQPARARRHERRRQARASTSGGGDGGGEGRDRRQSGGGAGGNRGRSSLDYASFHKGHGGSHGGAGGGGGAGHHGGHYQVHGAHHGHANDATSWRRDVPSPALGGTAGAAPAGEGDRPPPVARPPHVRRMSAGPGAPLTAPEGRDAPGSPFHHWGTGQPAAAREHVAVGPTAGSGFGFGRGRGRGTALAAPGSPMPAPGAAAGAAAALAPAPAGAPPAAPGSVPLPAALAALCTGKAPCLC